MQPGLVRTPLLRMDPGATKMDPWKPSAILMWLQVGCAVGVGPCGEQAGREGWPGEEAAATLGRSVPVPGGRGAWGDMHAA